MGGKGGLGWGVHKCSRQTGASKVSFWYKGGFFFGFILVASLSQSIQQSLVGLLGEAGGRVTNGALQRKLL